jgi:hypothetical protein
MLQMGVAKELGYTLTRLRQEITMEELMLWSAWFELQSDEMKKHK